MQMPDTNTQIHKEDPSANKLYTFVFKLLYTTRFFAVLLLPIYLPRSAILCINTIARI